MILTSKKPQTMSIKEFMSRGKKEEVVKKTQKEEVITGREWFPLILGGTLTASAVMNSMKSTAFAAAEAVPAVASQADIKTKVIEAFNPLIDLAQSVAYPVAFLSVIGAGIYWIIGNHPKAVELLQGATVGFVIVQIAPLVMRLLVSVTAGI
jgi:hypothetical protein